MKILHVIPSVSPLRGGPSKAVIEMVAALREQGIDAEIATTNDDGPNTLNHVPLQALTQFNGVPVRFFKRFSPALSPVREYAFSSSFKNWLRRHIHHYDLVHVHAIFSFTSTYAMYLARKRSIPYIVRTIGQLERWSIEQSPIRKKGYLHGIEKRNLLHANRVHFTAPSEQQQATELLPELTSMMVPLGINVPEELDDPRAELGHKYAIASGTKIIAYLSRIHRKKGLDLLLKALAQSPDTDWRLLIGGEGEGTYIDELTSLINTLKLNDRCQFIGFCQGDDKNQLLQGADLYALTSHSENFGIAVLEALAAGTPTLVSRGVALSTLVEKEKLGYVCELNIDSIQHTLEHAFSDQQERGTLARRYVIEHHQWPSIAKHIAQSYQQCIDEQKTIK